MVLLAIPKNYGTIYSTTNSGGLNASQVVTATSSTLILRWLCPALATTEVLLCRLLASTTSAWLQIFACYLVNHAFKHKVTHQQPILGGDLVDHVPDPPNPSRWSQDCRLDCQDVLWRQPHFIPPCSLPLWQKLLHLLPWWLAICPIGFLFTLPRGPSEVEPQEKGEPIPCIS